MFKFLLFIAAFLTAIPAFAHDEADEEHVEAMMEVMRAAIEKTPEEWEAHSAVTPWVQTGWFEKDKVYLNGPMYEYVRSMIPIYYRAAQAECDGCITVSEDVFTREAIDRFPKTFAEHKFDHAKHFVAESAEHISVQAAKIGARYGKFALNMKIAGEVLETVISKMAFMGGAHFFCNFIDVAVVLATRPTQLMWRAYSWAPVMERNRILSMIGMWRAIAMVKRVQKRVRFTVEPFEVDEEMLKELDAEGPNRWWGWFGTEGKRAAWIHDLHKRAEAADDEVTVKLGMKKYLGKRFKRFAWLKARRRGEKQFMHGDSAIESRMKDHVLWIMSVQANLVDRAVIPKGELNKTLHESLAARYSAPEDEIREGLAAEFSRGNLNRAELIEALLRDVEVIFNPKIGKNARFFHAVTLESMVGGFIYQMFQDILTEKAELYGASPMGILAQVRVHWNMGGIGEYIYQWADFLRMAALTGDPEVLQNFKYEAMESLARVLRYMESASPLIDVKTTQELETLERLLKGEVKKTMTFRPWSDKRIKRSWIPGKTLKPMCEELDRVPVL